MPDGSPLSALHSIRIKGCETDILCAEDQKVLMAMEQTIHFPNPRPVRVGCRKGGCGACRVKVTKGSYTAEKSSRTHVTEEEAAEGYALACRISPRSDLELEPACLGPRRPVENGD
ncbi:ferredoxin [Celeribacter ethanolicus]|uniref:Ferredoxin n=1 Tax=Celeribacter ethanolicus TaxID=1758178 RepID=A0A291GDM9_9RHOB|nr:2Fe-2S iron-sulfur cluster-binding protein [Celeribacter ethanolicus]ATG48126.1 ferredoxin [Celeribacter ethanolicus]